MKLKRLLWVFGGVGLVAYAALKGAVYYQVKTHLDRLGAMVAPFAALKYDGISSSLEGRVAVNGLTLTPVEAPVGIRIERVELQGQGAWFLLGLLEGFQADRLPPKLRLSIRRMHMPLGSGYQEYWRPAGTGTAPDLCTLGGLLGQTEIERLGFRQRVADARLRYDFDQPAGALTLQMDYSQDRLAALSVEMSLGNLSRPGDEVTPVLERFSLHYRIDPDYMRGAVDYCAGQAGLEPAAFIDRLFAVGSADYVAQLGFIPGEGLRGAMRRLISRPGDLLITSVPGSQFSPAQLRQYQPQELIRQLGIRLSVNDQPVNDLSFRLPRGNDPLTDLLGAVTPGRVGEQAQSQALPMLQPQRPRARFIATPVDQLSRYTGSSVRVYGSDRAEPQQGILTALDDRQLELEQRLYGGKMTLYIPLEKISRAEVLRWEQTAVGEVTR